MKIDKKIIKELSEYLEEFNLNEIEITEKDTKIKVSKNIAANISQPSMVAYNSQDEKSTSDNNQSVKNVIEVTSPIIGTAYHAPEPGAKKFIEVGKKIKKGDTIMIVEAMKTMNHVPSPIAGTIKKICVEDGQPVEYGHTIAIID